MTILKDNSEFDLASKDVDFKHMINQELLNTPVLGEALRKYLLLSTYPEKFKNITIQDNYYSRYYWYLKFLLSYKEKIGFDAGLEQQEFKILEEAASIPNIDWNVIEQISNEVKNIG